MFFGTSSPKTICTPVASSNATATAMTSATSASNPSAPSGPRNSAATDGSATKPIAKLVTVIPSWAPDRYVESRCRVPRTRPNRTLPFRARDSTRLRSTVTSAVSAATNTAFPTIRTAATPSRIQALLIR
jgi:hypothetical protein